MTITIPQFVIFGLVCYNLGLWTAILIRNIRGKNEL